MFLPTVKRAAALLVALILVSPSVLISGCGGELAEGTTPPQEPETASSSARTVRVETIRIEPTTFEDIISLIGVADSPRDATLSAQSIGTLNHLLPLGSRVAKGGVIARIDPTLVQAGLRQAQAMVESNEAQAALAEDTFRRQEPLYQDSIISALEFEQVRAQLNQARAQLSQTRAAVSLAEKQLENTYVRAPFPGIVETHFAEEGEQLAPGTPVVRLVDTEKLKVRAGVPERYAVDIRKGTRVTLEFKAYGIGEREGVISFVGNVIDPQNRSFPVEIVLDNSGGTLKPEMIADVFVTRSLLTDQFVVPQTAILRDEFGSSLYVVDRSNGEAFAARRPVELGASYGGRTVVIRGVTEGDEIIVVGQTIVTEGDLVMLAASGNS